MDLILGLPQTPPFPLAHDVRVDVEVAEEEEEGDHVEDQGKVHPQGKVAADAYRIYPHHQCNAELHQLDHGQVPLPPQMPLDPGRVEGGEAVVGVHDDVHERVDHGRQERGSAGHPLDADPPEDEHATVVVDV